MMLNGYGFFCKRKLLTIFSAPRYYPEKNNKGAILKIEKNLKIGFFLLNPVTQTTRGESRFRNDYASKDDDSNYVSRESQPESILATPASITGTSAASQASSASNSAPQTPTTDHNVSPDSGAFLQKK
uniref:Uncharacterized protein n=1 Tax=Panagrolaimus sp. PS1159 TaxID=55785 RepID=A0AC35G8Q5_9BILA